MSKREVANYENPKYKKNYLSTDRSNDMELVSNIPGTLTVEDHNKWYHIFYITEGGGVTIPEDQEEIDGVDHYYYPVSVVEYAKKRNMKIDYMSYAAICKMYLEDTGLYEILPGDLPTRADLESVLVDEADMGIKDRFSFCETYLLFPQHFTKQMCLDMYSLRSSEDDIPSVARELREVCKKFIELTESSYDNPIITASHLNENKEWNGEELDGRGEESI